VLFYVYLFFFVLSVLVQGLLPPSDNTIAVSSSSKWDPIQVDIFMHYM